MSTVPSAPRLPRLIAHRGNTQGVQKERENEPEYLLEALKAGYYVEADVWYTTFQGVVLWFLGHDKPEYYVEDDFLKTPKIYFHAKSVQTFYQLLQHHPEVNCFFHQNDDVTLTSEKEIWTYPGKELTPKSIIVLRPGDPFPNVPVYGICADDFRSL
jgi:hypothetical protein